MRPWTWAEGTLRERANMVRAHVRHFINLDGLADLFQLSRDGLQAILDGDNWRAEYERKIHGQRLARPKQRMPRRSKRPRRNRFWTGEKVTLLREGWTAGKSETELATELGCTRSAIAGKILRLHLTLGPDRYRERRVARARPRGPRAYSKPDGTEMVEIGPDQYVSRAAFERIRQRESEEQGSADR